MSLLILFFLSTVIIFVSRVKSRKKLAILNRELQRAIKGNVKTRLFANQDTLTNELIFSINELIEKLEIVQIENIQAQEARKRLLSSISHDIRTPLTSIIGYVDALSDETVVTEDERQEYVNIISKKSYHLKELIDQIFQMAKIDADEVPMNFERMDLAEWTRELVIDFLPELQRNKFQLELKIPEKSCYVFADKLSLSRVISNLIKNVLLHGKEGEFLGIEMSETNEEFILHIWDKGPGIEKEDYEKVFERMYRNDQSRTFTGGSGLGLAITKALLLKNGGEIWVESIPWKKTTFSFSIPKLRNN
ncbi:HAMP domain-containing sensor histidine kinase [Bacillus sp. 31A1R]|uniref:histidine kinase n=2 Tax=Robertmurraya mangrovi TaxID=3098077 RepID=A0ABU5IVX0_9BACI|nr:HAMP domain-containing sensor histidine kinase [Bacillus sp. 31A1R]MDZ5471280.1 HAMP domain-containing sensor histidine kinase [Bacillus sp. 31A1R]